jgi:hypothetical protein
VAVGGGAAATVAEAWGEEGITAPFEWDEARAARTSSWRAIIWAPTATIFWNWLEPTVAKLKVGYPPPHSSICLCVHGLFAAGVVESEGQRH